MKIAQKEEKIRKYFEYLMKKYKKCLYIVVSFTMSHLIVAQNWHSSRSRWEKDGRLVFTYHLYQSLHLREPYVARLVSVANSSRLAGGENKNLLVFCDFVHPQNVNGESRQLLGAVTTSGNSSPWVPVSADIIPSEGLIIVEGCGFPLPKVDKERLQIIIELAPSAFVHGANGQGRL